MSLVVPRAQREAQARFQRLCQEKIRPRAAAVDRAGSVSQQTWRELVAAGYTRQFHPREVGGAPVSGPAQAAAMESLGAACASTYVVVTASVVLCGKLVANIADPAQQERWLTPLIQGKTVGCYGAVERGAGNDAAMIKATLRQGPSSLLLSGEKARVINACIADTAVVIARNAFPGSNPASPFSFAIVDLKKRGVTTTDFEHIGFRGASWGTLQFDDVSVSPDAVFPATLDQVYAASEWGHFLFGLCSVGIAQAALDRVSAHAQERQAFGGTLSDLQSVHRRVAAMRTEIHAARVLGAEAALVKSAGRSNRELLQMFKVFSTEAAVRATQECIVLHGAWGVCEELDVPRLHRDAVMNLHVGMSNDRLRDTWAAAALSTDPNPAQRFDWSTVRRLEPSAASSTALLTADDAWMQPEVLAAGTAAPERRLLVDDEPWAEVERAALELEMSPSAVVTNVLARWARDRRAPSKRQGLEFDEMDIDAVTSSLFGDET
jgi:butyryl-CoA dehydrogenase